MLLAERIRAFREAKNLSQWDVEKRSGLMRVYLSRIENGYTIPTIELNSQSPTALPLDTAPPHATLAHEADRP